MIRSLVHRITDYLIAVARRELLLVEVELRKYQTTITLGIVGLVFLLIGRFSGIVYLSLIGALSLAAGLLKGVEDEKEAPK